MSRNSATGMLQTREKSRQKRSQRKFLPGLRSGMAEPMCDCTKVGDSISISTLFEMRMFRKWN
jgi:hypothetical protein